jgi:hypothetical protein
MQYNKQLAGPACSTVHLLLRHQSTYYKANESPPPNAKLSIRPHTLLDLCFFIALPLLLPALVLLCVLLIARCRAAAKAARDSAESNSSLWHNIQRRSASHTA